MRLVPTTIGESNVRQVTRGNTYQSLLRVPGSGKDVGPHSVSLDFCAPQVFLKQLVVVLIVSFFFDQEIIGGIESAQQAKSIVQFIKETKNSSVVRAAT